MKIILTGTILISVVLGKCADYRYDEAITKNRCKSSFQCDGLRTCSHYGWCRGVARIENTIPADNSTNSTDNSNTNTTNNSTTNNSTSPSNNTVPPPIKDENYQFDQGPTGNRCTNDYECAGRRTCSVNQWCEGIK